MRAPEERFTLTQLYLHKNLLSAALFERIAIDNNIIEDNICEKCTNVHYDRKPSSNLWATRVCNYNWSMRCKYSIPIITWANSRASRASHAFLRLRLNKWACVADYSVADKINLHRTFCYCIMSNHNFKRIKKYMVHMHAIIYRLARKDVTTSRCNEHIHCIYVARANTEQTDMLHLALINR